MPGRSASVDSADLQRVVSSAPGRYEWHLWLPRSEGILRSLGD